MRSDRNPETIKWICHACGHTVRGYWDIPMVFVICVAFIFSLSLFFFISTLKAKIDCISFPMFILTMRNYERVFFLRLYLFVCILVFLFSHFLTNVPAMLFILCLNSRFGCSSLYLFVYHHIKWSQFILGISWWQSSSLLSPWFVWQRAWGRKPSNESKLRLSQHHYLNAFPFHSEHFDSELYWLLYSMVC